MSGVLTLYPRLETGSFPEVRIVLSGAQSGRGRKKALKAKKPTQEVVVYQAKSKLKPPTKPRRSSVVMMLLNALITVSLTVAMVLLIPVGYYVLFPVETVPIQVDASGTPLGGSFKGGAKQAKIYQPPVDKTLPAGKWLMIPRIEVRTQLHDTLDPNEALDKGVWMAPDYGYPGDPSKPIILAAHRYGYTAWWESEYWKYNTFYNLPTLEPGDRVEIISNQQKWVYEIYAGEEATEISDYDADLILYTCKFLNSPVRHFRYARLIDPTKNTQAAR